MGTLVALGVVVAVVVACRVVDLFAQRRHWRVGGWGRVLCIWRRVGEGCIACKTDYRYVLGHPIRYTGETRQTARAIVPLCQQCWVEAPIPERRRAAGAVLNDWRANGVYGDGDTFDDTLWDTHRFEVFTAIEAGL